MPDNTAKIDTADLEIGMYVTRLDRSWLGTPFLLQGFQIESKEEIAQLREHCAHVFVDRDLSDRRFQERSRPVAKPKGRTSGAAAARPSRVTHKPVPAGLGKLYTDPPIAYQNLVTIKDELPAAKATLDSAEEQLTSVLNSAREGKKVNVEELETVVGPMVDSVLRNCDALSWLLSLRDKDNYAFKHSLGSSVVAIVFGRQLGLDSELLKSFALGALLFDVGKVLLPDHLLHNPNKLDADDQKMMEQHVAFGLTILRAAGKQDDVVETMLEYHHERHDGSGYPRGLAGDDIPVFGRMAGLIDTYDAMTSQRPYAAAKSTSVAMQQLIGMADTAFQRELVEQFIQAIGVFPTGALVEMNSGEVGVVVEQNRERRLRPTVLLLLDAAKQPLSAPESINLRLLPDGRDDPKAVWIIRGLERGAYGIDPADYYLD